MLVKNKPKLIKTPNKYYKSVHNLKHTRFNKTYSCLHIVSKELIWDYSSMAPIYESIAKDFIQVDLVDLEMYERWLNG
jgi:hypothetical protein